MKKLFALIAMYVMVVVSVTAEVLVTEHLTATKGVQVKGSVKADTYYIISGIDQASKEYFLYDNGGQVKGSASFPTNGQTVSAHIWTLKPSGNAWVISNVGTGNYMNLGGGNGSAIKTSEKEQANAIHFGSGGYLTILNTNRQAIDMTQDGANPTTWEGTTNPEGSRRLKIYAAEEIGMEKLKSLSLVPAPKTAIVGEGDFVLKEGFAIAVDKFADSEEQNRVLADVARFITTMNDATGLGCKASYGQADIMIGENVDLAPEGYVLEVTESGVCIQASTADGVYYAMQSLMRLLPPNVILGKEGDKGTVYALPVSRIEDEPRFEYRGFMLDVSRHFFTVEQVKKMIDLMAIYKMNVFHWHLTDDQGWRAEIKQYPLLTSKGAERKSSYDTPITRVEENGQVYWTGEGAQTNRKYGPFFYTQEEMKDVVRYAAERHIDVLPEVDMPGHFVAALAAYPQFGCNPSSTPEVWINGGISSTVLNVANPEAVQFAKNIITELCEIFPYPYFHIGGDECPTSQWEKNAQCQEKLKQLGKTSYRALQTEFIREINEHLATLGKKLFCWNESITDNGADLELMKKSGATIMCWNPCQSGAAKAASLGLNAVITEWGSGCYYINRKQSNDYGEPSAAGNGNDFVSTTYNYVPVPSNVSAEAAKYYIGVQATFWTEHVSSNEYLEYLALPRLMCVAEAGWTPQEKKDWKSFVQRMTVETEMLDLGGYIYARHWMDDYVPRQAPASVFTDGSVVTFTNKSADRGQCLADNNGMLNGQGSVCTQWTLEAATAGKFYIRSNVSGKYLYAANGNNGTLVELSTNKTEWEFDTTTIPGYVAICYNSVSGNAINNNVGNATKARLFTHGSGNGASFWLMEIPGDNDLAEGEHGALTYKYYYRGIDVKKVEFSLPAGSAYPSYEEHIPSGYTVTSITMPSGTVHLKSEVVEIAVERVPEVGRFYRFYNTSSGRYLAADNASDKTSGIASADGYTLFYYDDAALLSYERGQYLSGSGLAEVGADGAAITIVGAKSGAVDRYNILSNKTDYLCMSSDASLPNTIGGQADAIKGGGYDFQYKYALSLPVVADEGGWAAFSAPVAVTVPEYCKAYVACNYDEDNARVGLMPIEPGTTIAANTGLMLKAERSTVLELVISERGSVYTDNMLQPAVKTTVLPGNVKAYTYECIDGTISYRLVDASKRNVSAHGSWLQIDDANAPQSISVTLYETGVEADVEIEVIDNTNTQPFYYDLQGRPHICVGKGLYICNGKKILVK